MARVIDIDLDAIDQLYALFGGLDLLGCELGFRRDVRDVSVVDLIAERVGGHLDLVPDLDASEVLFPNVSAQPGMLDIAHGDDAGARGQDLTHIGGLHQYHAVDRRDGDGIGHLGVDQGDLGLGALDIALAGHNILLTALGLDGIGLPHSQAGASALHLRGGAFDSLGARPGLYHAGMFLHLLQVGVGALKARMELIVLRSGDVVGLVQCLGAIPVLLGLVVLGLSRRHGGLRFLDLLRAGAVFQLQQLRLGRAQVGIAQLHVGLHGLALPFQGADAFGELRLCGPQRGLRRFTLMQELLAVQARDDHTLLHGVAFVHGALDQAAGGFEGDIHLGQFDIARNNDAIGDFGMEAAVSQHAGRAEDRNYYHYEDYLFHDATIPFLLNQAADIAHGPPQVDTGYVVAEQRIDTVIPGPLQPGLGVGDFDVTGEAGLVTAAGLRELAIGQGQSFLGDLELFFSGMQAIERRADVEFNLLAEVVGADTLLAELGGGFGAPGIPPAAVENGHAQSEAIIPGGQ